MDGWNLVRFPRHPYNEWSKTHSEQGIVPVHELVKSTHLGHDLRALVGEGQDIQR